MFTRGLKFCMNMLTEFNLSETNGKTQVLKTIFPD